jgi:hypothetical protein
VTAVICGNFGLRKQKLGCNDGCGLMAVGIECRMLGTALCWNGRSDCLLHRFDVRLYDDGDGHYHCRVAVRSGVSDHKEHCRVTVTIRNTEHYTGTVTNMSPNTQCYQYVLKVSVL